MQKFVLLLVLSCVVEIRGTVFETTSPVTTLDCSSYANDQEVLATFPFAVPYLTWQDQSSNTFARLGSDNHVEYLQIANEKFVPSTVFCLNKLQTFLIRNTSFSQLTSDNNSIQRLSSSLYNLGIFDTPISHLPKEIGNLTRLMTLTLSNTGLVELPDTIEHLQWLLELHLSYQKISSLPSTLSKIRSLITVELLYNPNLRSVQSLNDLPNLSSLLVSHCSIDQLPRNLPQLYELYMSYNNLTNLNGIETLGKGNSYAKSFYFNNNHIKSIPSEISQVNNLFTLNVANNELTNIPKELFNSKTLRNLDVSHNLFPSTILHDIDVKFKVDKATFTYSI
ncbi:hypothetical protein I4U23_015766 [Adineta vaga]|nr:hypothetical protein I4U23_015766 [Adineta vaga]